jgi:glycerophosphoryl diester phosphodiesterase
MNPWLSRRVLAYAHQGGAKEAPSSTLYAMKKAIENGATALELDVHRTLDGHLVVCHDPTVNRTSNGNGAIAKMTLDQLQSLDNAYYWVPGKVVDHSQPESAYPLRGKAPADRELRYKAIYWERLTTPPPCPCIKCKQNFMFDHLEVGM